MMRKACVDRHLRIIGRPSPSHADCVEGLPMMRKAGVGRHLRIIGRPPPSHVHCVEGLPMMRKAHTVMALRIIGMPFVQSAQFWHGFLMILAIMQLVLFDFE